MIPAYLLIKGILRRIEVTRQCESNAMHAVETVAEEAVNDETLLYAILSCQLLPGGGCRASGFCSNSTFV